MFKRTTNERIDQFSGMVVHNKSSKLPGHKERLLGHFMCIHEIMKPVLHCDCGICVPRKFDWDELAEGLVNG